MSEVLVRDHNGPNVCIPQRSSTETLTPRVQVLEAGPVGGDEVVSVGTV